MKNTIRIITIKPDTLKTFCNSWPCSNLHNVDHVVIAEQNGDLIDLECFDKECNSVATEDSGQALSALVSDAIKHATKNPQPKNMINTGYSY